MVTTIFFKLVTNTLKKKKRSKLFFSKFESEMEKNATWPNVELFLKYDNPLNNSIQFNLCHQSYPFLHHVKVNQPQ